MKTSSTKTKTVKKPSTVDAERAMKIAFQELLNRASEEAKAARRKRRSEKFKQWQGAAKRFKGLSEALRLKIESRNIHVTEEGYHVLFMRKGESFGRMFRGAGEESLSAAIKFRDEAEKIVGKRGRPIPPQVLKALGLSMSVPGISRDAARRAYSVSTENAKTTGMPQDYSFEFLKEEDAYAAAIECIEKGLKRK